MNTLRLINCNFWTSLSKLVRFTGCHNNSRCHNYMPKDQLTASNQFVMDADTWKEFQHGSKDAFKAIYDKHWQALLRYTYSIVADQDIAKDILQEYFMEIWEKRSSLPVPQNMEAFLLFVLKHRILNALRKEQIREKHINIFSSLKQAATDDAVANTLLFKEAYETLLSQVNQLPPRMKHVFRMKHFENMEVDEIAATLNVSGQTVRNQLNEASHRLKTRLKNSFLSLML
jgi:RNA polymerase sigma-70 factor (family 1)